MAEGFPLLSKTSSTCEAVAVLTSLRGKRKAIEDYLGSGRRELVSQEFLQTAKELATMYKKPRPFDPSEMGKLYAKLSQELEKYEEDSYDFSHREAQASPLSLPELEVKICFNSETEGHCPRC